MYIFVSGRGCHHRSSFTVDSKSVSKELHSFDTADDGDETHEGEGKGNESEQKKHEHSRPRHVDPVKDGQNCRNCRRKTEFNED